MMKIFDLYSVDDVKLEDPGMRHYINLNVKLVLKTKGRERKRFHQAKVNIIERLINMLQVPGHRGKKHKIITHASGKYTKHLNTVIRAFKIIQEKTQQNPIQVFVKALENAASRDEITVIEYGGARYPQAVDMSPLRRVNVALHNIVHGAYDKSFNKKKTISETLAEEIIASAQGSHESFSMSKKNETEKQADSAR